MYFSENAVTVFNLKTKPESHKEGSALTLGCYGAAYILLPAVLSSSHSCCMLKNGLWVLSQSFRDRRITREHWQLDGQGTPSYSSLQCPHKHNT